VKPESSEESARNSNTNAKTTKEEAVTTKIAPFRQIRSRDHGNLATEARQCKTMIQIQRVRTGKKKKALALSMFENISRKKQSAKLGQPIARDRQQSIAKHKAARWNLAGD